MGLFSRMKTKEKEAAEPAKEFDVTVRVGSYFKVGKAGEGAEYHVFIDGEEHVIAPLKSIDLKLSAGKHTFRAYSTPETLGDVTEEFDITKNTVLSVTVNVLKGIIKIGVNA